MIIIFIIFYGFSIYFLFARYKNSEKKAAEATLEGEKELLTKRAKKHKKQAIFTVLYMLFVMIALYIMFSYMN